MKKAILSAIILSALSATAANAYGYKQYWVCKQSWNGSTSCQWKSTPY